MGIDDPSSPIAMAIMIRKKEDVNHPQTIETGPPFGMAYASTEVKDGTMPMRPNDKPNNSNGEKSRLNSCLYPSLANRSSSFDCSSPRR